MNESGLFPVNDPKIVARFSANLDRKEDPFSGATEAVNLIVSRVNALVFVLELTGSVNSKTFYAIDLDDVYICEDSWDNRLEFEPPSEQVVESAGPYVPSVRYAVTLKGDQEFSIVKRLLDSCRQVSELWLRLNALLRDSFYAGVYSQMVPEDGIKDLHRELAMLKEKCYYDAGFGDLLVSLGMVQSRNRLHTAAPSPPLRAAETRPSLPTAAAKCVYCQVTRDSCRIGQTLMVHPYVDCDLRGKSLHICTTCQSNWQLHRKSATDKNVLVLNGEFNEEICAVCSDSPTELVMCLKCPRSFCHPCLKIILSSDEFTVMQKSDDWSCMVCVNNARRATAAAASHQNDRERSKGIIGVEAKGTSSAGAPSKPSNRGAKVGHGCGAPSHLPMTTMADAASSTAAAKRGGSSGSGSAAGSRDKGGTTANRAPLRVGGLVQASKKRQLVGKDALPPVNKTNDEIFYFGQYLSYCHRIYDQPNATKLSENFPLSEDMCFLCKDGGELIECDFKHPAPTSSSAKGGKGKAKGESEADSSLRCPCLKVYHEYCLNYAVGDEEWRCPRHFCDSCGSKAVFYMCKYCPIAICERCPGKFSSTYGLRDFLAVPRRIDKLKSSLRDEVGAQNQDIQLIVCATCIKSITKAVERGDVEPSFAVDTKKIKQFPLTPSGSSSAGSGKERKKSSGESYDEEQLKMVMGISSP